MTLKGDIGYLKLEILTNKTSFSDDFWEENWLYTLVEGNFPGFTAAYECYLRTDDLKSCYEQLSDLLNNKSKCAQFNTLEEGIELNFERNIYGSIDIKGRLIATELTNCSLNFSFNSDNPTVTTFNLEIYRTLMAHPIIGQP